MTRLITSSLLPAVAFTTVPSRRVAIDPVRAANCVGHWTASEPFVISRATACLTRWTQWYALRTICFSLVNPTLQPMQSRSWMRLAGFPGCRVVSGIECSGGSLLRRMRLAGIVGVFRRARISSLATNASSTEDNIPFQRLANHVVLSKFWKVDLDCRVTR